MSTRRKLPLTLTILIMAVCLPFIVAGVLLRELWAKVFAKLAH